jgi:signal transduction histidine kinase
VRRRLLASTLAIAVACVVMLGLPLAILARHQVYTSARDRIREQAASVATGLEDRLDARQQVDLSRFPRLLPDRRIVVRAPDGSTTSAGPAIEGLPLSATVNVADYRVTVQTDREPIAHRADVLTLLVAGIGVLAMLAAAGLALGQTRRLARPVGELAARADRLGRGEFAAEPLATGVPEIDHVSQVLERSARQIGTFVELQRHFASDAAHQLRTPLTSIGLHLDELSSVGDDLARQEAEDALAQVERLDGVITSLLARARGDSAEPELLDLSELAGAGSTAWEHVLSRAERQLVQSIEPGVHVIARREHVLGVISSLLDNAVSHGRGTVTLLVGHRGSSAELSVGDEGEGVPPDLLPTIFDRQVSGGHGTGIGLALAHSLASAEAGTLSVERPALFVFRLPLAEG